MGDIREMFASCDHLNSKSQNEVSAEKVSPVDSFRRVCLTYDDGPAEPFTHEMIDLLARLGRENNTIVLSTFFVHGAMLSVDDRPDNPIRRADREGHLIANHGFTHPHFSELNTFQMHEEIHDTNEKIGALGIKIPKYFRAPYGDIANPKLPGLLKLLDMTHVGWEVDSSDWTPGISVDQIVGNVLERFVSDPHDQIILLHDGGGDRSKTVKATEIIVKRLLGRGYRFVKIDEIH